MNTEPYVEKLKQLKKEKKLTYDDIANLTGYSRSTITNIFCGYVKAPRYETISEIERALGLESPRWTEEEREQGITDTVSRKLTVEEDDILSLLREIEQKKGANAQALARKILEQILNS